jgi:predicted signal transduction protein with EAL and GGDEF domain
VGALRGVAAEAGVYGDFVIAAGVGERMIDLDMIHAGLDQQEFLLEYLPILSIDPERCLGAEALLREQRPGGLVFPDAFVPLIENPPLRVDAFPHSCRQPG